MIPLIKKLVYFKVTSIELYPRIPWELVSDPLRSAKRILETTGLT
jgi:hypothetical protein